MEKRYEYLNRILKVKSPLALISRDLVDSIIEKRSEENEPIADFLLIAELLKKEKSESAKTRAEFIIKQCNGEFCEDFFEEYRDSWGIPIFAENLISIKDFKNGFLWRMKSYTTSFGDDSIVEAWFLKSYETLFITRYEAWESGKSGDELFHVEYGNCKKIFKKFISEYGLYKFVKSPVLTHKDLKELSIEYSNDADFIEEIKQNVNWQ
ncbi:hypothetical protein [Chondrinema litorale]|uniref:hypothetical protein n=1 Tax=Chondrinema litorale TaxID=2994555 RepID=UPI002543323D|nr:hypothetical protein [Chondrinema litorale]UZR98084.1 hypothetical protein OQ292_30120 [Chondrinema litorale]